MDSIMGNNTWVLADLPLGCKPLGCKWIFKIKLKARISTIILLIAMASIHNLIIHHIDVKKTLLNGDLEEEVYMNQPHGLIMPGNKNKVCKLIKSLYGLKQVPKQWHSKFDEVVLSNGYLFNQADKCVYSKFDKSGKELIISLYVNDMLIFSTNQVQVDLTKEFLSLNFSMKDMVEDDVILTIRIKYESNGIAISQSHYIEKAVSQLEYSTVIGCLMYDITCTRPDITFVVVLKGYTDVSWISNTEDNSSISGWVFLLGGGVISWASKKQTCITGSTMESKFMALAAAGKEAEWLKNLLLEILLCEVALLWRRGMLLLMLTNKGWVNGNGSNPGGGLGKPRGGRETRRGEDGLEGSGSQLSMVVVRRELLWETHLVTMKRCSVYFCHEKVVKIPLPYDEILRVLGERLEEKVRHFMSAKAKEQKLKDIVVVRNFSEVFPDDLLGLAHSHEIESCVDLIPGAMCWELNVRSIPTSSVVFPLHVMCSHCQNKFPLLEESFHCQKKFPLVVQNSSHC
nr:hypothetical protein [Tanacetum cinerariifolium]